MSPWKRGETKFFWLGILLQQHSTAQERMTKNCTTILPTNGGLEKVVFMWGCTHWQSSYQSDLNSTAPSRERRHGMTLGSSGMAQTTSLWQAPEMHSRAFECTKGWSDSFPPSTIETRISTTWYGIPKCLRNTIIGKLEMKYQYLYIT